MFSQEPYHRPPTKKGPETLTFHALLFPLLRSAPIASSLRSVSSVFSSTREFHLCPAPEVASGCLHVARCREDQSPRRLALCLAWNSQGKVKASDGFPAVLGTRGGWAHIGWRPARQELPKVSRRITGLPSYPLVARVSAFKQTISKDCSPGTRRAGSPEVGRGAGTCALLAG